VTEHPHTCPFCGGPATVLATTVECPRGCPIRATETEPVWPMGVVCKWIPPACTGRSPARRMEDYSFPGYEPAFQAHEPGEENERLVSGWYATPELARADLQRQHTLKPACAPVKKPPPVEAVETVVSARERLVVKTFEKVVAEVHAVLPHHITASGWANEAVCTLRVERRGGCLVHEQHWAPGQLARQARGEKARLRWILLEEARRLTNGLDQALPKGLVGVDRTPDWRWPADPDEAEALNTKLCLARRGVDITGVSVGWAILPEQGVVRFYVKDLRESLDAAEKEFELKMETISSWGSENRLPDLLSFHVDEAVRETGKSRRTGLDLYCPDCKTTGHYCIVP
jgi:hypothetical protein